MKGNSDQYETASKIFTEYISPSLNLIILLSINTGRENHLKLPESIAAFPCLCKVCGFVF